MAMQETGNKVAKTGCAITGFGCASVIVLMFGVFAYCVIAAALAGG